MLHAMLIVAGIAGYPDVMGYTRDQIRIYEVQGGKEVYAGSLDKKSLPARATVVDVDAVGRPGVKVNGRTVYLKNSDIYWEGVSPCKDVTLAERSPNDKLAATPGVSAGLSGGSQKCVK